MLTWDKYSPGSWQLLAPGLWLSLAVTFVPGVTVAAPSRLAEAQVTAATTLVLTVTSAEGQDLTVTAATVDTLGVV